MATAIRISVYVQPRASRTQLAGRHGESIKIRLAAAPVDNAANEALIAFVAQTLRIPKRAVRLVSGMNSRCKLLEIEGLAAETIAARLTSG